MTRSSSSRDVGAADADREQQAPLPALPAGRPLATIAGVGARTLAGLTALQVTMSARAQKFPIRESHLLDRNGELIAVARLMSIGDQVTGLDRFLALGVPPLRQACFPWMQERQQRGLPVVPVPLVLALPSEHRPGFDPRLERDLLPGLSARANVPLDLRASSLVLRCRGGGVAAFERAIALLQRGEHEAVLVGGLDSYFDPDVLEHLDEERRLHGPDTENGFIPGEGAACALLVRPGHARGLPVHGHILSVACAEEPRPYGSEEPCLGLGITLALKRATAAAMAERNLGWVLTDVTNERHRVDEWTYGFARTHAAFADDVVHEQPLLKTGDLGAASAAVLLAMAAIRWQTGCAEGPAVLIAVHSDGPTRGALVAMQGAPARRLATGTGEKP